MSAPVPIVLSSSKSISTRDWVMVLQSGTNDRGMMKCLTLLGISAILGVCTAHLCLLNPSQRGGVSETALNTAANADCLVVTGPCGSAHKEHGTAVWQRGKMNTVIFQKNLDHWDQATPGYFQVNLMDGHGSTELARVDDGGEPSLHEYVAQVTVPNTVHHGAYILQVMYVTNNAAAPSFFYQCADITVQ